MCQLSSIDKLRSAAAEETSENVWAYQKQERPSLLTNRPEKKHNATYSNAICEPISR